MKKTSSTRTRIGAASLFATMAWQVGAAPEGLAQLIAPQPLPVAPHAEGAPKAEEAETTSLTLTAPALTGPLTANPAPFSFDTGFPLGKFYFGGAISALGMAQSQPVSGNSTLVGDMPNALVWLQNNEGPLQFFAMAGGYSFPALGTKYLRMPKTTGDTFKAVPIAYGKFVLTDEISLQVGKLPTLIGAEYAFTFQNMNIARGLLWAQEPLISRGIQGNYASGPFTFAVSFNDGFYSNNYNWVSGLASYALDKENTIAVAGGGSFKSVSRSSFVTPVAQNNSRIINVIYTYNSAPWTVTPYFQYTDVPNISSLGLESVQTYGGAILANYKFNDNFSLAGRFEYIASSGSGNVLYGSNSSAGSLTVTPTYQLGIWFLRGEASVTQAFDIADGAAFGKSGNARTQVRGIIETGILF